MQIRRTAAALTSAAALSVTGVAMATPAQAQPLFTGGLVNITVTDVLNDNEVAVNVQVPIGVAVNVCGLSVAALAEQSVEGPVDCTSSTMQDLPVRFRQ